MTEYFISFFIMLHTEIARYFDFCVDFKSTSTWRGHVATNVARRIGRYAKCMVFLGIPDPLYQSIFRVITPQLWHKYVPTHTLHFFVFFNYIVFMSVDGSYV